ncbi:DedA family protein [Pelagovum pacificum]|uniref:DedA family protein n=1 Tax=Pelagovum pacificum TaxID=2588711 RepID=UPI0018CD612F|nr:VTT domain-containing protein [Pelagovum pacificum]QQA44621.1 VTT domain-containing protein [Pelagovum pacificum]
MTEWLLTLVPLYGPPLLALAIFLSCFALPIPASALLLAAGGFASAGDLVLWTVVVAAFAGLWLGDNAMFLLGRKGGTGLARRLGRRAAAIERAREALARRGGVFIFLSRWLFSPLGPYVNFAAGASGKRWVQFVAWGTAGEIVWLSIYLGLGYVFTGTLEAASDLAFDVIMLIGAGFATVALGVWLFGRHRDNVRNSAP